MAKIAKLHDGAEIHFPDSASPEKMDAAVGAYHAGSSSAMPSMPAMDPKPATPTINPDIAEPLLQALSASKAKAAEDAAQKQILSDAQRKEDMLRQEEAQKAYVGVAEDIAMMLNSVKEALAPLDSSQIPEKLDILTRSVDNLGKIIENSLQKMIDFAKLPRNIVNAPDGTPTGIVIGGGNRK